jgi:pimeloyl-ACP methyl ester carboxylesterase
MMSNGIAMTEFRHWQVEADGIPIHVVEAGSSDKPTLLFLHGWPESWTAFESTMTALSQEAHVVAIDLPGIGGSTVPPPSNDKKTLALTFTGLIERMDLPNVTLIGHDVGGQIVYAYLHAYSSQLSSDIEQYLSVTDSMAVRI